jgi:lysyl-tRNA synthetase class 1
MEYSNSKAWPFREARKIVQSREINDRPAVFCTGYGPSGLPHIGTFAEVFRTTVVQSAYQMLTGNRSRLIVFSDDMDALRSVPDNVPHPEMLREHIGVSLCCVPDPFDKYESFAAHNNAMLRSFLDRFGFEYEFISSQDYYTNGRFDSTLDLFARNYDAVRDIILPTLGEERRATYSPFMPIDPETGRVFDTGVLDVCEGQMTVNHPDYGPAECLYTGGGAKLQWKADWAMRWIALGVDYEMAGKDLIDSVALSTKIVRKLGYRPPAGMIYEMFLDADGHKISKSKGNGLTIDTWLDYGSRESLSYYLFQSPSEARKLFPGVIPRAMDDLYTARRLFPEQTEEQRLGNAVLHIDTDSGRVPPAGLTYALLLNIASTAVPQSPAILWRYVERLVPDAHDYPELNELVLNVFQYYWNEMAGRVERRPPTAIESEAMLALASLIETRGQIATEEEIQFEVYEVGKSYFGKENLRDWFKALYEVLLGQSSGPRFGAFTVLYGRSETVALLRAAAQGGGDE